MGLLDEINSDSIKSTRYNNNVCKLRCRLSNTAAKLGVLLLYQVPGTMYEVAFCDC